MPTHRAASPPRRPTPPAAPAGRLAPVTLNALAAVLLATVHTGCQTTVSDEDFTLLITTQRMLEVLAEDDDAVLVDVRPATAFRRRHIPGAMHVPYSNLFEGNTQLPDGAPIIVYSEGYEPPNEDLLSWAAAKKLLHAGYTEVYDYRGGLRLWASEGRPLAGEQGDNPPDAEPGSAPAAGVEPVASRP